MAQFRGPRPVRPQRSRPRHAPKLVVFGLGCAALIAGWRFTGRESAAAATAGPLAASVQAAGPLSPDGLERFSLDVAPGESLLQAVLALGVAPEDAQAIATTLAPEFGGAAPTGLGITGTLARPPEGGVYARLVGLSIRTGPSRWLTLSRGYDGRLNLNRIEVPTREETVVVQGSLHQSLYESALRAGASPELTEQAGKLFGRKIDFARDVNADGRFRMVFERRVSAGGQTMDGGELLYAELGAGGSAARFYRFQPLSATEPQFYDETGRNVRGLLLRTPVAAARVTSGFGMRMHPILGYTRMHQGIDFGAPVGTPVFAAGDGVVERAEWAGGYGRFLQIRHGAEWSTGYGHLSAWLVKPGQFVRQGQVVAYVGNTGSSTGPHLHFEVMDYGAKIDPAAARVPQGSELKGRELAAFAIQKGRIDALLEPHVAPAPDVQVARMSLRGPVR